MNWQLGGLVVIVPACCAEVPGFEPQDKEPKNFQNSSTETQLPLNRMRRKSRGCLKPQCPMLRLLQDAGRVQDSQPFISSLCLPLATGHIS